MTKTEQPSAPRRALGRGLGALLPPRSPIPPASPESGEQAALEEIHSIPIELIDPNPYQPRRNFQAERLEELAQSIRSDGLIQPIVVRRSGPRYVLIVGERRCRAARLAGLTEIPAIVREIPDDRLLEATLIENIQREDLNPIEAALAFERMGFELHLVHDEIAHRTGKDRSTITNFLRLLKLPKSVQELVAEGRLTMGHARAILGIPDERRQRLVAKEAVKGGWSVRQVERLVKRLTQSHGPLVSEESEEDANVAAAIREMEQVLGTRVRIVEKSNHKGRIEIEYYSADDLDRIYSLIVRS